MPFYTDQINRFLEIPSSPRRIVSLVPSQTEFLFDLGLAEEVVGITKFCVHPQTWFRQKQRIGGTKNIHLQKIIALQPDLIIANKEENVKEQIEALAAQVPVWVSDVNTLEDAFQMMQSLGKILQREQQAMALIHQIKQKFHGLSLPARRLRTAYLIWKDPWMAVGGDTFIHHLLQRAGFENIFADQLRYPIVTIEALQAAHCELLLLSTEPFPFQQKHVVEWQALLPAAKIVLADGELFSWYGSRLLKAPGYFADLHRQIADLP